MPASWRPSRGPSDDGRYDLDEILDRSQEIIQEVNYHIFSSINLIHTEFNCCVLIIFHYPCFDFFFLSIFLFCSIENLY